MGDYAVPEQIREYKPKGTVVKKIAEAKGNGSQEDCGTLLCL